MTWVNGKGKGGREGGGQGRGGSARETGVGRVNREDFMPGQLIPKKNMMIFNIYIVP